MKVLSLFDGMSCGMVAFERAKIPVTEYHACEIDKHAIKVSNNNYPSIIRHGSVTEYHPDISFDYLIGGSPCQGFSFAGKQLAFNDPRSALFFEYVRILKACREINPGIKFLLENVRMKKEYLDVISEQLGVQPVCINSALVSAQNRVRYYWANFSITHPEDKRLLLKDIIEDGAVDREKSYCIDANYFKGGNPKSYFEDGRRQLVFKHQSSKRAMVKCAQTVGRKINPQTGKRDDYNSYIKAEQRLEIRDDEKTGCLSTVQKDNVITDGIKYRKLTVLECERLQTLPDNYTAGVSNTQRYKMLGNGWTVDVIKHILECSK